MTLLRLIVSFELNLTSSHNVLIVSILLHPQKFQNTHLRELVAAATPPAGAGTIYAQCWLASPQLIILISQKQFTIIFKQVCIIFHNWLAGALTQQLVAVNHCQRRKKEAFWREKQRCSSRPETAAWRWSRLAVHSAPCCPLQALLKDPPVKGNRLRV